MDLNEQLEIRFKDDCSFQVDKRLFCLHCDKASSLTFNNVLDLYTDETRFCSIEAFETFINACIGHTFTLDTRNIFEVMKFADILGSNGIKEMIEKFLNDINQKDPNTLTIPLFIFNEHINNPNNEKFTEIVDNFQKYYKDRQLYDAPEASLIRILSNIPNSSEEIAKCKISFIINAPENVFLPDTKIFLLKDVGVNFIDTIQLSKLNKMKIDISQLNLDEDILLSKLSLEEANEYQLAKLKSLRESTGIFAGEYNSLFKSMEIELEQARYEFQNSIQEIKSEYDQTIESIQSLKNQFPNSNPDIQSIDQRILPMYEAIDKIKSSLNTIQMSINPVPNNV